jgi:hypothetical protein
MIIKLVTHIPQYFDQLLLLLFSFEIESTISHNCGCLYVYDVYCVIVVLLGHGFCYTDTTCTHITLFIHNFFFSIFFFPFIISLSSTYDGQPPSIPLTCRHPFLLRPSLFLPIVPNQSPSPSIQTSHHLYP